MDPANAIETLKMLANINDDPGRRIPSNEIFGFIIIFRNMPKTLMLIRI